MAKVAQLTVKCYSSDFFKISIVLNPVVSVVKAGLCCVVADSTDIIDRKLKLILGLIWTLILHYSISMPMWEGEEPTPSEGGPTPKQRLLNWIQSKVPDMPIKNFTTDWNDGRAIGALVDACGPGQFVGLWL